MVVTIAAAVVLSVVTTSLIVGSRVNDQLAQQTQTITALEDVTTMSMDVSAEPDAEHVAAGRRQRPDRSTRHWSSPRRRPSS